MIGSASHLLFVNEHRFDTTFLHVNGLTDDPLNHARIMFRLDYRCHGIKILLITRGPLHKAEPPRTCWHSVRCRRRPKTKCAVLFSLWGFVCGLKLCRRRDGVRDKRVPSTIRINRTVVQHDTCTYTSRALRSVLFICLLPLWLRAMILCKIKKPGAYGRDEKWQNIYNKNNSVFEGESDSWLFGHKSSQVLCIARFQSLITRTNTFRQGILYDFTVTSSLVSSK